MVRECGCLADEHRDGNDKGWGEELGELAEYLDR